MVRDIEENPEMEDVLKLHKYIQKIKAKQSGVKDQVQELQKMFDALDKRMTEVSNAQGKKSMDEAPKPKSDAKTETKK